MSITINLPEWLSLFSLPFMQRAVAGGILLGLLGGLLGSFVILRKLSLFGNGLGHAAILGVVVGVLLDLPPTIALIGFLVVCGLGVIYLIDRTDLGSDTILGILVAGSVALGTIGFSFLKGYRGNLLSVLFGDILAINSGDLMALLLLLGATVTWFVQTLPDQVLLTFNVDLAKVRGIPVQRYRYLFIVVLSLTIALTIRAVGILLVNAFLVIPAATAKLVCHQFIPFLVTAAGMGAGSGAIGMILSGSFDLPSGPSIVLVQLCGFFGAAFLSRKG